MKIVCSLNGANNSGKTTQIKKFAKDNPDIVAVYGDISHYAPYPKFSSSGDLFKWWFVESAPDVFSNTIFECLYLRNAEIINSRKPIVLIDKGIANFEARVVATLIQRGLTEDASREITTRSKEKYNVKPLEGLSLLLTSNREFYFNDNDDPLYRNYQLMQKHILQSQLAQSVYTPIDANNTIEEIYGKIKTEIIHYALGCIKNVETDCVIYGISGLSESGKSTIGQLMSTRFNIWNIKLRFFWELICNIYEIPNRLLLFQNDQDLMAILFLEQLASFFIEHPYQSTISIESLHSFTFTKALKQYLGKQFKIIYVNTPLQKRIERTKFSLKDSNEISDVRIVSQTIMEKDELKKSRGTDDIEQIADFIVHNQGNLLQLSTSLSKVTKNYWGFSGVCIDVNKLSIPDSYKTVILDFCQFIKKALEGSLHLLLLTGGCVRSEVNSWSDIDFILVTDKNDKMVRHIIDAHCLKQPIKIGTTIYSSDEAKLGLFDPKTVYYFYNMQQKQINPLIISENLLLPIISKDELFEVTSTQLYDAIHRVRRELYSSKNQTDYIVILKHVVLPMRIFLLLNNINPIMHSYKQVLSDFSILTGYHIEGSNNSFFDEAFVRSSRMVEFANSFVDFLIDHLSKNIITSNKNG